MIEMHNARYFFKDRKICVNKNCNASSERI